MPAATPPLQALSDHLPESARFLRDGAALGELAALLKRGKDGPRVWVVSGSVGEDAYSACAALLEVLDPTQARSLKVFGTASSAAAVRKARAAVYDPKSFRDAETRRRLSRHFLRRSGAWAVGKAVRERCMFAIHDVCQDPPFSKVDAVVCGLPLAGWPESAVERVLARFAFALPPGGVLLVADQAFVPRTPAFERLSGKLFVRTREGHRRDGADHYGALNDAAKLLHQEWRNGRQGLTAEDSRRQDELAAAVSHELRTPLAAIIGYAETLNDPGMKGRQRRQFVSTIEKNARRLLRTVDGLIGSVAAPSQRQSKPVSLRRAAMAAASILSRQARAAGVRVRVSVPAGLRVLADPADLPNVLENLIGNAIKYNRRGGRVDVAAMPASGRVSLRVSDDGPGIPVESLGRVFDRFYRCPSTRHVKGSGMGLAIVRNLVEANGGSIHAESEPGRGAAFVVDLPNAGA